MPGSYQSIPRYPALLGARIAQADHLARALQALSVKALKTDPSYLWLLGRADEVRTLVGEVAREWTEGSVDTAYACEAIRSYVGAVHVALHHRYGGIGAACCGPHLEPLARPQVHGAPVRAVRAPFDSEIRDMDESPASRARPVVGGPAEVRRPAQRKSAG